MTHPETITCSEACRLVDLPTTGKNISYMKQLATQGAIDVYAHDARRVIVKDTLVKRYAEACRNGELVKAREAVHARYSTPKLCKSPYDIKNWKKNETFRIVGGKVIQRPRVKKGEA